MENSKVSWHTGYPGYYQPLNPNMYPYLETETYQKTTPVFYHGLQEAECISVPHAIREAACISYIMGKTGCDFYTAWATYETWRSKGYY